MQLWSLTVIRIQKLRKKVKNKYFDIHVLSIAKKKKYKKKNNNYNHTWFLHLYIIYFTNMQTHIILAKSKLFYNSNIYDCTS